jgi:beta-galactosidase/beta-glucuronidase
MLMKDMNMNAVRMSHYPPDDHFLDACDSLGLFVLDELTGWHHHYDMRSGHQAGKRNDSEGCEPSINSYLG